ncbi:MAG: hypothetical protein HUJ70_01100 [Pseudobutyrivibrio sp.]|nr:hypothetical protein [Pseudobutyrivibrio sp.]
MIGDFLKKYQQEIISEKIGLKEELDLLETKIKEEKKFIEVLDISNESYFSDFTPRDVNAKNRQKILEVQALVDELQTEYDLKSDKQKFLEGRLREVKNLLKEVYSEDGIIDKSDEPDDTISLNEETNSVFEVSNFVSEGIYAKLEQIKSFVFVDPQRVSLEIEELLKFLKK